MLEPESSEKYTAMSQRYMEQADEEFLKGDLGQASNKAWGAAALALKSIAERRGWNHNKHGLLYDISGADGGRTRDGQNIRRLFRSANAMHQNYYEDWMAADEVRGRNRGRQGVFALAGGGDGWGCVICVRAGDGGAGGADAAADYAAVRAVEPQNLGEWCDVSTARTKGRSR